VQGGIPEVIEDLKTGLLVPARDPDAIAIAIQNLISDNILAKRFGEALREDVRINFTLNRVALETSILYTKN